MAAPRQGLPVRLERAPHRGAAFALSNASKRARTRSIGSRSRGSLFIFRSSPAVAPPGPSLPCRPRPRLEHAMSPKLNAGIAVIGIDIGKNSFHVVGLDRRGAIVLRQRWSRGQVEGRLANLPPCVRPLSCPRVPAYLTQKARQSAKLARHHHAQPWRISRLRRGTE